MPIERLEVFVQDGKNQIQSLTDIATRKSRYIGMVQMNRVAKDGVGNDVPVQMGISFAIDADNPTQAFDRYEEARIKAEDQIMSQVEEDLRSKGMSLGGIIIPGRGPQRPPRNGPAGPVFPGQNPFQPKGKS